MHISWRPSTLSMPLMLVNTRPFQFRSLQPTVTATCLAGTTRALPLKQSMLVSPLLSQFPSHRQLSILLARVPPRRLSLATPVHLVMRPLPLLSHLLMEALYQASSLLALETSQSVFTQLVHQTSALGSLRSPRPLLLVLIPPMML